MGKKISIPMEHYDSKSIGGAFLTITFAFIGQLSLSDWATLMAIGAGATTIAYNIVKIFRNRK